MFLVKSIFHDPFSRVFSSTDMSIMEVKSCQSWKRKRVNRGSENVSIMEIKLGILW